MDPSVNSFNTATTSLGYTWDVAVLVSNKTRIEELPGISAYQVKLGFNYSHVNVVDAWLPKTDPSWIFFGRTTVSPAPLVDNVAGYVLFNSSITTGDTFAGAGKLAVIRFKIVGTPPENGELFSNFDVNNPDTYLRDSALNQIPTQKEYLKNVHYFSYVWSETPPFAKVFMDPEVNSFNTATTPSPGYTWNVTVFVENVTDLYGYQIQLYFDPARVQVVSAYAPKTDPQWVFFGRQTPAPSSVIKNVNSYVQVGDTILIGNTFTGTGKLAVIRLKIISAPEENETLFTFFNINNPDMYLLDSSGEEIPTFKRNGYFEYKWLALPQLVLSHSTREVTPPIYTAVELETFNVTVWLGNIVSSQALVNATFSLRYNATFLNPTQVIEEPFLATRAGGFNFTFDYYFGFDEVTIKHYMNPPYINFPYGSGPIVTVVFQGIYQDSKENNSTLELVDVLLKDLNGNEIATTSPVNGSYNILPIGSSIITIYTTPGSAEVGADIIISGTLKPTRLNVNITIYYRTTNEVWNTLATTKTDSHSNYTFPWTTTGEGNYEIKANWAGDANTNPAESEIKTVTIRAKPSKIDFTLYAAVGAGVIILIAIAVTIYFLKLKKPKPAT